RAKGNLRGLVSLVGFPQRTHVQVNMYSDRLEILNPGGLYGATTVESLGREGLSSTRNEYLSRLLMYTPYEDGFIVENKGTGFMTIADALSRAGMAPVKVASSPTFFRLTMFKKGGGIALSQSSGGQSLDAFILSELDRQDSLCMKDLISASGFSRGAVALHLKKLVEEGQIEPTERARSPKQRYRRVLGQKSSRET
ncbi:MAG: ATP-binding protein, partial [Duodenibacillus sp.]